MDWIRFCWAKAASAAADLVHCQRQTVLGAQVADGEEGSAGGAKQDNSTKAVLLRMWGRLVLIMQGVWIVFMTPSFILILIGNIIGTIVGLSMGYKVLYFQVCPLPSHADFTNFSRLPCSKAEAHPCNYPTLNRHSLAIHAGQTLHQTNCHSWGPTEQHPASVRALKFRAGCVTSGSQGQAEQH